MAFDPTAFGGVARAEAYLVVFGIGAVVLFRILAEGPVLTSLLASRTNGPMHGERALSLGVTFLLAGTFLHNLFSAGTHGSLPDVSAGMLAALGAGHGSYLFGKHIRKR